MKSIVKVSLFASALFALVLTSSISPVSAADCVANCSTANTDCDKACKGDQKCQAKCQGYFKRCKENCKKAELSKQKKVAPQTNEPSKGASPAK